jgi:hypothetical protein
MKLKLLGVLMLCTVLLTFGTTVRATTTWVSGNIGDWSDPANWVGCVLPITTDTTNINNGVATLDASQQVGVLFMGNNLATDVGTLNINSDVNLTISKASNELLGLSRVAGATGTINHSAGTVKVYRPDSTLGEVRLANVTGAIANYNLSGTGILDVQVLSRGDKARTTANFNATGGTLVVRTKINKFGRIAEGAGYGFNQGLCRLEVGGISTVGAITVGDGSNSMDYAVGAGGTLAIDIASAVSYDTVTQHGDLCNTAGATLSVNLLGGYVPTVDGFFNVWTFSDKTKAGSGAFASLPSGWTAAWVDTNADLSTDTLRLTYIPEPATIALPIVNVKPWSDPNIRTFDPNHRPPDMDPNDAGDEWPWVDPNHSFRGWWDANGVFGVNDVNVTIEGRTEIRVPRDANGNPDANVLDHEANGHDRLNRYVYQDANKIIEDAFRKFIGKRYVGEGNTLQQRDANALQQAQNDANKLMDRAIDAIIQDMNELGEKFDKLTNSGIGPTKDDPNALTNEQGVEAVKKEYDSAPKAGKQPAKPDEKQEKQSGVDGNESSLFFDNSEQKLYLNEGLVLNTASNPADTILGRGEVHIDPIVLIGVQENGTVSLSDTRLRIIDNVNGGALLDGFILEVAYMESNLPGFAGMIQGYLDVPPAWAGGINNTIGSEFLAGIQAASEAGDCNRLPMVWFYADQQLFDGQGESSIPPTGASGKLILGVAVVALPPWPPDFVPDDVIDCKDLDVLADNWLSSPPIDPNVDLYPDGRIDFKDFAEFGRYWRQHQP